MRKDQGIVQNVLCMCFHVDHYLKHNTSNEELLMKFERICFIK